MCEILHHKTSPFPKLFKYYYFIFFETEFQNHGNEHDHGLLCIQYALMYGMNTNEKLNDS
jgi:hypothetical protein